MNNRVFAQTQRSVLGESRRTWDRVYVSRLWNEKPLLMLYRPAPKSLSPLSPDHSGILSHRPGLLDCLPCMLRSISLPRMTVLARFYQPSAQSFWIRKSKSDSDRDHFPSLTLSRLIRDQANKTLDLYIQRIRKFSNSMAESGLPPTASTEPSKPDPRIATSNEKSWAGWAISSFTNKIATADGEIEPTAAASSKPAEPEPRPASVPRPAKSSPSTQLHLPREPLRPASQPLGRSLSDRPAPVVHEELQEEEDDVFDAWGAMDDDEKDDDPFTAAVASPDPSSPDPNAIKPSATPFDDAEPDFAGWLAAKNQAKAKKPLPKGLSKAASSTTVPLRAAAKPRTAPAPSKKIDTKPKDEDEEDGWGDAWE